MNREQIDLCASIEIAEFVQVLPIRAVAYTLLMLLHER